MPPEVQTTSIARLVRLETALLAPILQRRRAGRRELDAALEAPRLDQAADVGRDLFVSLRRAHDLERSFEVREPRHRALAADLEQPRIVGPRHAVELHVVVFAGLQAPLHPFGSSDHGSDYSPRSCAVGHDEKAAETG
jgi:hypothetical protein